MRFSLSSAGKLATVVLSIIGIGGIPDDIQTLGEWLQVIDAWMDHGWFRVLVWAVSVTALTYPQWYPGLRRRFAGWQRSRGRDAAKAQPAIPAAARYTMQGPGEILQGLKGLTSLEAGQRAQVHLGLRMKASGVVTDLHGGEDWGGSIAIHFETDEGSSVYAVFSDDWKARARTIRPRSRIAVDGEIREVRTLLPCIVLEDARLLPDGEVD